MKAGPGGRTHPLRLRGRLVTLVAIVVAAVAGATAWTCLALAEGAFETAFADRLDRLVEDVRTSLDLEGRELVGRLERAGTHLLESDTDLLERLLDPERRFELAGAAHGLANQFELPLLEILDQDGRILSSAQWPERAGKADPAALRLPAETTTWVEVETPQASGVAWLARHTVEVGQRRLEIVGGRVVDVAMLRSLVGSRAVAVLVADRGPVVSTRDGEARSGGADTATRSVTLAGPSGGSVGRIDLVVDRTSTSATLARLRWAVLTLIAAGAAVGAVAGLWISRRATRPVDETLRALDAIAAGEADYTFPQATRDDLEALPEAFSRLHRSLQDQSRRRAAAERVAAWREVARRVAHEVKNPLAPIRLTVENLLKSRRQAPEMFDEIFDDGARAILEEVEQLQRLVTEFSEFARLPEPKPVRVDLEKLLDSILGLYSVEPGLDVERKRAPGVLHVRADPDLLARALKNLIANAVESMGAEGGTLGIETEVEDGQVIVRVVDTGPGFTDDAERHLFEPYFTTKASGTGLGMALAYRIVAEHGGFIAASNRPGGGAEVVVKLTADDSSPIASRT